jgi:hypothetical protein
VVLTKLTSIKPLNSPQLIHITTAALDDKVASVRKEAAALLVRLLVWYDAWWNVAARNLIIRCGGSVG